MDADEARKRRLVEVVAGDVARATGRRYQINLERLDEHSLRELQRLLRDLDGEKQAAVRRARIFPWQG